MASREADVFKQIHEWPAEDEGDNFDISRRDDTLLVELCYPPRTDEDHRKRFVEGRGWQVTHIEIDQMSVRATDGIRLNYDYKRDGWVIEQASRFAWPLEDQACDRDWQEVAFIQSWARAESKEEQARRLAGGAS